MSNSMPPHGLQHARPPYPSPTPGVYPNSCPLRQWCHPTVSSSVVPFSSCLQSFQIRVFSNESALLIRWPKYWSFSFNISPSNKYSGLVSFRMDRLDFLAVQGTLKSLLQHHSSKASNRGLWFDSWIGKICWRRDRLPTPVFLGFLCGSAGKESACNAGDMGLIPRSGRSPGEWKGHPPQHSGLENSMYCIVHGVAAYSKCSVFLFFFSFISFSDVTPSFSVPLKPQIH